MSPPGRPKGEYRSAQHEGNPFLPMGRPKGEYRSAQHEGSPMSPTVVQVPQNCVEDGCASGTNPSPSALNAR
jgi:hypothetical protein